MYKKVNENSMASGAMQVGPVKTGIAFPKKKKPGNPTAPKKAAGKHFVMPTQERALREAIRKVIAASKIKFYEEKGKQYLQEQALRGAINKLLREDVSPEFGTTGESYGFTAFKRILQGLKSSYTKLKTTADQRSKFLETIESVIPDYLDLLDAQRGLPVEKEEAPEPTGPQPVNAPVIPNAPQGELEEADEGGEADVAGGEDAAAQRKTALRTAAGQTLSAAGADTSSPDATGETEAYSALRTALPQIGEEYEKLSLDSDRKAFRGFIFGKGGQPGTLQLTMAAVEKELLAKNPAAGKGGKEAAAPAAPAAPPEQAEPAPEEGGEEEAGGTLAPPEEPETEEV